MNDMKPKRELTYATVCSGIECMSVACIGLPMRPVFFSEIEPFPCAVLKAHYPDVPNLGDMSAIRVLPLPNNEQEITNGTTVIRLHERLGILAGGTPCQDVSVAGKRAGMQEGSGTRSSLAFDFVRLARELRPRWVLWENVAGSIDSKNAPDFLRFASALGDCGYSLAWRVLDAQYVRVDGMERAVPQRRRRVWVVGCLGADESVPAQILFEPDCVAGHTPPRRRTGQGFAYTLAGRDRVDAGVVGEPAERRDGGCRAFIPYGTRLGASPKGITQPLTRIDSKFQQCIALDGDKLKPREDQRKGGNGFWINEEGAGYTLTGVDRHGVAYGIDQQGGKGGANSTEGVAPTVLSDSHGTPHGVAYESQCYDMTHADDPGRKVEGGISPTLQSRMGTGGNQVPLCVMAYRPPIQDLIAEACAKYGADWPEDDWVEVTDDVLLNIYIDMDGRRRATAFQKSDANLEFGVDISYVGDGAACDLHHTHGVISTNSNGEDVAATINANMSKLGGDNQTTFGGGMS